MDANKYTRSYLYSLAFLFLIAMHYFQVNPGGYGLSIGMNNTSWIAISIIISVGLLQWLDSKRIKFTQTDMAMFFVVICLFIPFFWSQSPWVETAYSRYFAIIAFWMLIVAGRQLPLVRSQLNNIWLLLICGMIIQCLWGIAQFLYPTEIHFAVGRRPFGSFQQVNVFSSMISTVLGLSVYLILSQSLARFLIVLCWLQIFLAGLLLVLVQSRTGILGAVIVTVFLFIFFRVRRAKLFKITIVLLSGVLIALLLIQLFDGYKRSGSLTQDQSRSLMYKLTFDSIKDKPFLGHGLGSFFSIYAKQQAEYFVENPLKPGQKAYSLTHPHNELLFWWVEGGLLAVLSIILFSIWFTWRVWRLGQAHHKALWLCCIPIIMHTQTEYPMYHSVMHLAVLAILILQVTPEDAKVYSPSFSVLPKLLLLIFPVTFIFMMSNLHAIWLMKKSVQTGRPDYLFDIINPFGQVRHLNYIKSDAFMSMNNTVLLKEAEKYIKNELVVRPHETGYRILYRIEQLKPNNEQAIGEALSAANYYYPNMIIPSSVENSPQNGN